MLVYYLVDLGLRQGIFYCSYPLYVCNVLVQVAMMDDDD